MSDQLISYSIMGIPERLSNIQSIRLALEAPVSVFIDFEKQGLWWNAQRAWTSANNSTYHCVLQDDIQLCSNFHNLILRVLQITKADAYSLYHSSVLHSQIETAYLEGYNFIETNKISCGQATILKTSVISEMLYWINKEFGNDPKDIHDDIKIGAWLHKNKAKILIPIPEFVRHLGWNSSSIGFTWDRDREYKFFANEYSYNFEIPNVKYVHQRMLKKIVLCTNDDFIKHKSK